MYIKYYFLLKTLYPEPSINEANAKTITSGPVEAVDFITTGFNAAP